ELPVALLAEFDDLRVVGAQRRRQGDRAADAVLVQHLHLAHVADAVAVVADAVAGDGRVGVRPRLAERVGGRIELVELDVGGHPEGHPGTVGPGDPGAVLVGPVVVVTGIFTHWSLPQPLRLSSQSNTSCTLTTSAYFSARSVRLAKW